VTRHRTGFGTPVSSSPPQLGTSRRQSRVSLAIRKYGANNFRFEVIETLSSEEEAYKRETWWIQHLGSNRSGVGYNLEVGGLGGKTVTESTRKKMSAARLGKRPSLETRARMAASQRGKKRSPEACAKTAAGNRGKKRPPEVIAKIAASRAWWVEQGQTPEARAKMSAALRGKKPTPEVVEKRASSNRGRKRSPEAVARMTAAQQARRALEASKANQEAEV